MSSPHLQRIRHKAASAVAFYFLRKRTDVDPDGGGVVIYDFPLPKGFNYSTTAILLLLPADYPMIPPQWFYMDPKLRRLRDGQRPEHYFERWSDRLAPVDPPPAGLGGWLHSHQHAATVNGFRQRSLALDRLSLDKTDASRVFG
ncbi:MAG: hypothetical protein NZ959_10085 [Armatimonadetes bacterium]|nr:hypothetical protein [Armatimonadota bacterium]MDW8122610.1 E2/UBC family protein [Armatimonadota bacterium]